MKEIEIEGGLKVRLIDIYREAVVINSPNVKGDVFIPRFVKYKLKKYKITSISEKAFDQSKIESITFPNNSEVRTFRDSFLYFTDIKKLQIPVKLKNLGNPMCVGNKELTMIEVSPKNKNFIFYNEQFLLGKSDDKSDTFDILHLARSDIEEAIIPSQIKIVKEDSFFSCYKLKAIIFPDNSETKSVERSAFYNKPIEKLKISANIEYIDQSNFSQLSYLNDIEVSPENKLFQISGNLLVKKSDPNSQFYDHLIYCYKNVEEIMIPSHIKVISSGAFSECEKLHSLTFQPNSSLEVIDNNSFAYCHNLKSISFPKTVKKIGNSLFYTDACLESVQFLGQYIELGSWFVKGCEKLKVISFPNATEINFTKENSLEGIPKDAKIIVHSDAKLIGPGIDQYKNHIIYNQNDSKSISTESEDENENENDESESTTTSDSENEHQKIQNQDQKIQNQDQKIQNQDQKIDIFNEEVNDDCERLTHEIERLNGIISNIQSKAKEDHDSLILENKKMKKLNEKLQKELDDIKQKIQSKNSSDQRGDQSEEIKDKSANTQNIFFVDDKDEEFQEIIEKVGEGASSVAFKIIDHRSKRVMCKKVLKSIDEKETIFKKYQNSIKEIEALNYLRHPCICEALGLNMQEKINDNINKKSTIDQKDEDGNDEYDIEYEENDEEQKKEEKTTIALFIEYLPYKLKDVLEKNILNDTLKVRVAIEIAFGMSHIHSHNMMHRDLKIDNIM